MRLLGRFRRGEGGVLTLAIEGPTLRLLQVQKGCVTSWTTLPFNPSLMQDGRVANPAGLAEVIKNGLARLNGGQGPLVTVFPGTRLTIRVLAIPRVRGVKPEVMVPREARRILGAAAEQQILFWTPLKGTQMELRYFLVAVPRAEMARFMETLELSGLKPRKVDARSLALARAVSEPTGVVLRLEPADLDVTIVVDKVPQLFAWRALEFGMSPEDLLDELADAVQTTVIFHASRAEGASLPPEAPLLLVGGHPQIDESLARALTQRVGREVRCPTSPIPAPDDFPALEYLVNLGLALKRL
ncbi:MAG: hypothetical protein HYX95_03590 [Chloroflexi bacterium]|nr:hypothetical protein [Chloroflexota bacterium]